MRHLQDSRSTANGICNTVLGFRSLALCLGILGVLLAGCQSNPEDDSKLGLYTVKERQTQFYRYGPAQSFGPDFALSEGQKVVLVNYDRSYSKVMTEDGVTGYVATEDLKVAPPPPKLKLPATARRGSGRRSNPSRGPSSANQAILESGPLFEPDLPALPEEPVAAPNFLHNIPER